MKKLWGLWALCALLALFLPWGSAEEESFAPVTGEWFDEDGVSRLFIDTEGFFSLTDENGLTSGLLAFSGSTDDAEDALPEAEWLGEGVRYVMYLENGDPAPGDAWLFFDAEYPEELVFLCGETARVYLRQAQGGTATGETADVKVQWAPDALRGVAAYDEFVASRDPMAARIAFTAENDVRDFQVLALTFDGIFDDGTVFFSSEPLYTQPVLQPGRPLVVTLLFEGDMPSAGISYVDQAGQLHRFAVDMSGKDGELYLWKFGL